MKKVSLKWFPILFVFAWGMLVSGGQNGALEAQMNTLKQECRELISGARYEGSKITYFSVMDKKQVKEIEIYTFLSNEYLFALSTKNVSSPITIKIFDTPQDAEKRILIKEFKKSKGENLSFSSVDLNKSYKSKNPKADRLKNLYIEYHVNAGKPSKEGVVFVYGSKSN